VGLLAVDVTSYGVVMSADNQQVEILGGESHVLPTTGQRSRNHILIRSGGGFAGLVGYVGTESIGGIDTMRWLRQFSSDRPQASPRSFLP
jgi:hypothetical protein